MGHLSLVDAARLRLETPTTPMTITALLFLEGALSLEHLRELIRARLLALAPFRMRIDDRGLLLPRWVPDPRLDVRRHVFAARLPPARPLADLVSDLGSALLPNDRPRWSMHLVDDGSGSVLVARIHHCVGDGVTLLRTLGALADSAPRAAGPEVPRKTRGTLLGGLRAAAAFSEPDQERPALFDGQLGSRKRFAWAHDVPLSSVLEAARRGGATLGETFLATTAGGLRRWMTGRGVSPETAAVSALVPMSLPHALGSHGENHFGSPLVPLPVGVSDPADRLWAVHRAMTDVKRSAAAPLASLAVAASALLPARITRPVFQRARAASLTVSVLRGPTESLALGGARVRRIVVSIPAAGPIPLTMGFLTYAGDVSVGMTADAGVIPDLNELASCVEAELRSLAGVAREAPARAPTASVSDSPR